LELNMAARRKRPSASDVLRQEMQQPLVIPDKTADPVENAWAASAEKPTNNSQLSSPPINSTKMNQPTDNTAANEAKLKQQIEDLQSKLKAQTDSAEQLQAKTETLSKELKDAKKVALDLASQDKAPAKSNAKSAAIVKTNPDATRASLTARPVQTSEETAIRRANTDIGWLD
jgi:predicted RNase H-like nuclease (RuvC/YqgF family)